MSSPSAERTSPGPLELPQRDPLPRLGRRVALRRLEGADLAAFQAYRSDEAVGRYQGWSAQSDREALAFLEEMRATALFPSGAWVQLAVADRQARALIGDVGVCVSTDRRSAELGFTIAPGFQGQGLGTEALRETIALVLEHSPVDRIVCITDARNTASIRLLERAGMRGVASAAALFRGAPCIEHTYAIERRQFGEGDFMHFRSKPSP